MQFFFFFTFTRSMELNKFYKTFLNYLGYEVSPDGIRAPSDRVKIISDYALPEKSFQLRRFVGMLNFFRRNIPNFANLAFSVTELLRLNPKSSASRTSCPLLMYQNSTIQPR